MKLKHPSSTCTRWAEALGWPAWVPVGNGMLLWSSSEDGEGRDLCASIAISHGEVRATVSLQYLGESVNIGTFCYGSQGVSGYLIGGLDCSPDYVAERIRMHIEHLGEPVLIECERLAPRVPSYLWREMDFGLSPMEFA